MANISEDDDPSTEINRAKLTFLFPFLQMKQIILCILGKNFSRCNFEIFFIIFPTKEDLTFHANSLLSRQFT